MSKILAVAAMTLFIAIGCYAFGFTKQTFFIVLKICLLWQLVLIWIWRISVAQAAIKKIGEN